MVDKTGVSVERITGTRMPVYVPFVGHLWLRGIGSYDCRLHMKGFRL